MNLLRSLARILTRARRALLDKPSGDALWGVVTLSGLLVVELFARRTSTDFEDAAAVLGLSLLGGVAWHRFGHRTRAVAVWGGVRERLRGLRLRIGLDLRHEPPVERRWPRAYVVSLGVLLGLAALVVATAGAWPGRGLGALRSVSGLLTIALLSSLWAVLVFGTLTGLAAPFAALEARFQLLGDRRYEVVRLWLVVSWVAALVALALLLPTWVPFVLVGTAWALNAAIILPPSRPPLAFLWRYDAADRARPAALPGYVWMIGEALLLGGTFTLFATLALGERLGGASPRETAITGFLGHAFAWSVAVAYSMYYFDAALQAFRARRANPARPVAPRVRVHGLASRRERRRVRRVLADAGFRVELPRDPHAGRTGGPLAASIVVDAAAVPDEWGLPRRWPRSVRPDALEDADLHRDLRRRCEVLARRRLRRGLRRLFKIAARRRYASGSGYWVGPHLWFVTHLSRDSDEMHDGSQAIGPPYFRLLEREARHHLFVVLRALEIDLIFVEDGVGFRRFQRVLAMLFEHHDIFAGRRPLEERHFSGLPGVRVLIHVFELDEPFRSESYPEPDYEDIARARILHVFRDRGEDEVESDVPRDLDRAPAPRIPQLLGR